MIRVVQDDAGFDALGREWNGLLAESRSNGLFLTWEWLRAWWRHLAEDRRLSILVLSDGDRLAAIAPLALSPARGARLFPSPALEFLGTGPVGSDYLDLIVRRGQEEEALRALAAHPLAEQAVFRLHRVRGDSSLAWALAERLRERGGSRVAADMEVCPFIRLGGHTWDSFLETLGPEHRSNLRRRLKTLASRFDVSFEPATGEAARGEAFASLLALHEMRWRPRGGSEAFHTPGLRSFHEEISRAALARGWLRLYVLRLDGRAVAALYGFAYGGRFYFYQSGFDPAYARYGVGLVAMGLAIRAAIEEGLQEYDLLHGDEAYKFLWAREVRHLARLEIYPPGAWGALQRRSSVVWGATRGLARRVVSRTALLRLAQAMRPSSRQGADGSRLH